MKLSLCSAVFVLRLRLHFVVQVWEVATPLTHAPNSGSISLDNKQLNTPSHGIICLKRPNTDPMLSLKIESNAKIFCTPSPSWVARTNLLDLSIALTTTETASHSSTI